MHTVSRSLDATHLVHDFTTNVLASRRAIDTLKGRVSVKVNVEIARHGTTKTRPLCCVPVVIAYASRNDMKQLGHRPFTFSTHLLDCRFNTV